VKVAARHGRTHNPSGESCRVSRLRENSPVVLMARGWKQAEPCGQYHASPLSDNSSLNMGSNRTSRSKPLGVPAKTSVLTQVCIALCVYLLLAFIKFQSALDKSRQQIRKLLQLNLFEKRDLYALILPTYGGHVVKRLVVPQTLPG